MKGLKRVVHFYEDPKFLSAAIAKFANAGEARHVFFSIGKFSARSLRGILVVALPTKLVNILLPFWHWYFDAWVIHGFSHSFFAIDYTNIPTKLKVLAIFWGFDLYSLKGARQGYLQEQTLEYEKGNPKFQRNFQTPEFEAFIGQRVDFVSTIVPNEFELLRSHFPNGRFIFRWFSYFDLENDVLKGAIDPHIKVSGSNLMLGNNASPWNNHLDAARSIKAFGFEFDKIICPLSYSGSQPYVQRVVQHFDAHFGERFLPLTDFMAYADYIGTISTCRFVYFNSNRQIGLGNLLFSIYLGSVVILNTSNPLYAFFNSNGIRVFSVEEAQCAREFEFDLNLSRVNLMRLFAASAVRERTAILVRSLLTS